MTSILLKSEYALYCYTIYTSEEVKQLLEEIKQKCNDNNKFNYIKKLAGFKSEYLSFLDDIYEFMLDMKRMNETFNRSGCTKYITISNKGVLAGQVLTVAKLFNRTLIFSKALESINKLIEYNNMLDECELIKDGDGYIFYRKYNLTY